MISKAIYQMGLWFWPSVELLLYFASINFQILKHNPKLQSNKHVYIVLIIYNFDQSREWCESEGVISLLLKWSVCYIKMIGQTAGMGRKTNGSTVVELLALQSISWRLNCFWLSHTILGILLENKFFKSYVVKK